MGAQITQGWRTAPESDCQFCEVPVQVADEGVQLGLAGAKTWADAAKTFIPAIREELVKSTGRRVPIVP